MSNKDLVTKIDRLNKYTKKDTSISIAKSLMSNIPVLGVGLAEIVSTLTKNNNEALVKELFEDIAAIIQKHEKQLDNYVPSSDLSTFIQRGIRDLLISNEERRKYIHAVIKNSVQIDLDESFQFDNKTENL